jgi:putative tricarboxylic transport membrane protein
MITQMHDSEAWQATLAKYGWQDLFVTGDEFGSLLSAERERVIGILTDIGLVAP